VHRHPGSDDDAHASRERDTHTEPGGHPTRTDSHADARRDDPARTTGRDV
jgi:hypothetical protein